jgi:hypothetical protein
MSVLVCKTCNKSFKFKSYLERHNMKKIPCKPVINVELQNIDHLQNIDKELNILNKDRDDDPYNIIFKIKKLENAFKPYVSDQELLQNIVKVAYYTLKPDSQEGQLINNDNTIVNTHLHTAINNNNKNNNNNRSNKLILNDIINNANMNDNDEYIHNSNNIVKNQCMHCKKKFAFRQGLNRHIKLNRCTNIININNINNTENNINNTTNNISNSNINVINNTILTINPLGLESLDHIRFQDLKKYFKNWVSMICDLGHQVYKDNKQNINFFKDNKNSKTISYLNESMEIKKLPTVEFKKKFTDIMFTWYINLIYMHKPNLSENEISHLIAQIIYLFNKSTDSKENIKQFNDLIDTAIEDVVRMANKKVIDNIKTLEIDYKDDDNKKKEHIKLVKYKKINKKKAIDEYYKPSSNTIDNKNLNKIKRTEEEKLKFLEDRQRVLLQASSLQPITLNILTNHDPVSLNQLSLNEHLQNII